ncbi:MAG: dihydrodipicolinate synthase family protein [Verrucomicrobia bacterium]|nr:dihydrodipicolinate synthase family protein [Verrucomicrobiota bacterium]
MKSNHKKYHGVVVPMVTPVTATGALDEAAARRIIDHLLQGGVEGVFVLGTTGEAASVAMADRIRLVQLTTKQVAGRAQVYAGINENSLADAVQAGNRYFGAGVDAVVSILPSYYPLRAQETLPYFSSILDRLEGPVILYNIPATTKLAIPLETIESLMGHPQFAGLKDSENNAARHETILQKWGGRENFSIFVGVGALMGKMLLRGADGIVPSVGNLLPALCQEMFAAGRAGDKSKTEQVEKKLTEAATLYQRDRTLGQSLAALKAAMSFHGLCSPAMLSPLLPLTEKELDALRQEMVYLGLTPAPDAGTVAEKSLIGKS